MKKLVYGVMAAGIIAVGNQYGGNSTFFPDPSPVSGSMSQLYIEVELNP